MSVLARGERTYEEFDLAIEDAVGDFDRHETPRSTKRTPVVRRVEYSPYPRNDASEHLSVGFTANESRGGVCMLTHETHPIGQPLRISVREVDGSPRLEAIARVAWCNPDPGGRIAVGLEFLEVRTRATRARLRD